MRQWNVNPKMMCRQHLLGEHQETHMIARTFQKGKSMQGYYDHGLVAIHTVKARHDELVEEMKSRGYSHWSPLEDFDAPVLGTVDAAANEVVLATRCERCRVLRNAQLPHGDFI